MMALVAVRGVPITLREALAPLCLLVLAGVELASSRWAEDGERALVTGHQTLFYAAALVLMIVLVRDRLAAFVALGGAAIGTLAVAIHEVALLLQADPNVVISGRLDEPMGYVNGQAAALLLGVWPLVAIAERSAKRALAGAALGSASLLLSMLLLTQSRGAFVALGCTALVLIAVIPGRARRVLILGLLAGGLATGWGDLTGVYDTFSRSSGVDSDATRAAVRVALVSAVAVGAAWAVLSRFSLDVRLPPNRWVSAGAGLAALLAVGVIAGPGLADVASRQISEFKTLKPQVRSSRLTSGGGNRYDYWRIAVKQFERWPLQGVGAGNFDRTYFIERRTQENVQQPHSLELQVLAETGLFGGLALAAFLAITTAAIATRIRRSRASKTEQGLLVACLGVWISWLVQTSVDWTHLLPGVSGVALLSVAILIGSRQPVSLPETRSRVTPIIFAALTLAIASLGVLVVADGYRARALRALPERPAAAVSSARSALRLNGESQGAYVVLAAAQSRLANYEEARAALRSAARAKPHAFLPHALLGDLALRRGDLVQARRDYSEALRLNPRDGALRAAVRSATPRKKRNSP